MSLVEKVADIFAEGLHVVDGDIYAVSRDVIRAVLAELRRDLSSAHKRTAEYLDAFAREHGLETPDGS